MRRLTARFVVSALVFATLAAGQAHADDERVDAREIVECERGLRAWLTNG